LVVWYHGIEQPKELAMSETEKKEFNIQIDRIHYKVPQPQMTGLQLRQVPTTAIGADRDLFEVVPGGTDRKIADEDVVQIHDGKRFFTAPAQINPGGGPK
jgi:hypothetical protein